MAAQLYREGNSHTVRGIECEVQNFPIGQLNEALDAGWLKSPEDIGNDAQNEITQGDDEKAPEEESKGEKEEGEKLLNPIRQAAKEAGIDGWEIKRIKTLEGLLDELKD